jgi:hypothetical protein
LIPTRVLVVPALACVSQETKTIEELISKRTGVIGLRVLPPEVFVRFPCRIACNRYPAHQEKVEKELQGQLDESRKQIVDYFVPRVVARPPDAMRGQFLKFEEAEARVWLDGELDRVFPKAEELIQKMQLDVRYKDVTFETLNREDFLDAIKEAFQRIDWDKAYKEFRAAGEKEK